MQESLVFLILGAGRLREDQLIYVERKQVFHNMGPLRRTEAVMAAQGDPTPYLDLNWSYLYNQTHTKFKLKIDFSTIENRSLCPVSRHYCEKQHYCITFGSTLITSENLSVSKKTKSEKTRSDPPGCATALENGGLVCFSTFPRINWSASPSVHTGVGNLSTTLRLGQYWLFGNEVLK